ncbi:hypothetical protein [Paenibacillus sp. FSL H8-0079]|uniref:hypothetical protein n=1 Tax=Paenibacillus sp. FSL H8-0079 TaxID=2921375 RepID=UPI0030EF2F07
MNPIRLPNQVEDYKEKILSELEHDFALPVLKGTDKQINWARNIRMNFFIKANKKEIDSDTVDSLKENHSAGWWIKNKDMSLDQIIVLSENK